MNNRKIIDYIVLKEPIKESTNLLERITNRIEVITKEIEDSKSYIDTYDIKYKSYTFMHKIYSKYEYGNEYDVLTDKEIKEWESLANYDISRSEGDYSHPLEGYKSNTGKIIFGYHYGVENQMTDIGFGQKRFNLNRRFEVFKNAMEKTIKTKKLLEKELKILESDMNPITNKYTRTEFEILVINLIKEGYEPLSGVSVSYDNYYQTMVKYQE